MILICIAAFITPIKAQAQNLPPIIRDTEIEYTLKAWLSPLLKAANMPAGSVNLILVQSPDVNAFVAGGANIFIYTGLIEKTQTPEELIGVMAHELGHIAGGHLIRAHSAMERASFESILGTVAGIGAAVLTGRGDIANAVISGGQTAAQAGYLSHSRVQESAADQAALRYMTAANFNPAGLKSFLETLGDQELLPASQQVEYVRTHPLTNNRIEAVTHKVESFSGKESDNHDQMTEAHARMKAKLIGFISPARVAWTYNQKDDTIAAVTARAIAAYKNNDVSRALKYVDDLIAREPQNAYHHELKGQMLVDFGRVDDALIHYKTALKIMPQAGLIRMAYGHALLSSKADDNLSGAIETLERAARDEPRSSTVYRYLATAYGRAGNAGAAQVNLAEEAFLRRRYASAKSHATAALRVLDKSGRHARRAQDILIDLRSMDTS